MIIELPETAPETAQHLLLETEFKRGLVIFLGLTLFLFSCFFEYFAYLRSLIRFNNTNNLRLSMMSNMTELIKR